MDKRTKKIFQRKFRSLMVLEQLTQSEVAKASGLPRERINYYYHGGAPTEEKLQKLAEAFKVPPSYFTEDDGVGDVEESMRYHYRPIPGNPDYVMLDLSVKCTREAADVIVRRAFLQSQKGTPPKRVRQYLETLDTAPAPVVAEQAQNATSAKRKASRKSA